jgi:hypothetical protein
MDDRVPVEIAAASTGIPARTIRYWVARGKLPAIAEQRRKLVRLADVRHLAVLTGRTDGNGDRHPIPAVAVPMAAPAAPFALAAGDGAVLARIRDEWIQPLVVQVAYQAECIGRLEERIAHAERRTVEAERRFAAEQLRRERAEGERDRALQRVKELALAHLRERAAGAR